MGKLVFHGQSCMEIVTGDGTRLLVDPFLTDNPMADVGRDHFTTGWITCCLRTDTTTTWPMPGRFSRKRIPR